jgi:hypothetical protein
MNGEKYLLLQSVVNEPIDKHYCTSKDVEESRPIMPTADGTLPEVCSFQSSFW